MGGVMHEGKLHSLVRQRAANFKRRAVRGVSVAVRTGEGGEKKVYLETASKHYAPQTLLNLAVVREHFGMTNSDAIRTALHLTAQAIRSNKALPEVK